MKRHEIQWVLPPEIEAHLGEEGFGRQRAIFEGGHLLLILNAPPEAGTVQRQTQLFLRKPDGSVLADGRDGGEGELRELMAAYRKRWDECDADYDAADSADDLFHLLARLSPLNRASTNLAAALQAARDHSDDDKFIISMRDEAYEISRAYELLLADAKLSLDYRIAKNAEASAARSEEMAAAQHKLNVLAAVTFPIMALATVLGMNLTNGLEENSPLLFISVLTFGLLVGALVRGWVMRGTGR